ncbi:MAG: L,D-transpeptidase [Chloroflexi bacterium]|nr:L,D-transpeptidase [Chloroflexota bacterium]
MISRRAFLQAGLAQAGLAAVISLPLATVAAAASCTTDTGDRPFSPCGSDGVLARPAGDPPFEPRWVATFLPTKLWPTATEIDDSVGPVEPGALFRVDAPQRGYRLFVWDPRENRHVFLGSEAVGPADEPFWSAFADDGRWIDVSLGLPQRLRAMQGDQEVFRDLITAGIDRRTKPGFYRILRRVANETMDSRTVPDATRSYLLKDVLYTQYFHNDGSAIHYNWWAVTWGAPGSQGCLGMRLNGARYMWDWATVGTPLAIHE